MKTSLSLAVALALSVPLAALAQSNPPELTQEHFELMDIDKSGGISEVEYRQFMEGAFGKLDADANGRLSPAETGKLLSPEQFSVLDANSNGEVTQAEFLDQVMQDFRRFDSDGDGKLRFP